MKTTSLLATMIATALTVGSVSAANLVSNGDFSSNAAGFGANFPGYVNSGGNPAAIDSWTHNGTGQTGVNGVGLSTPFGPSDQSATTYYGFVQAPGSQISQTLTLATNTTYDISFIAASRSSNPNAQGRVTVADNSTTYYDSLSQQWDRTKFEAVASQFSTGSSIDGPVVITLANSSPPGDNTVNYSSVVVEIVPEPSSLALLGLGGLLIARRRRG